jgi:hypothetical protein
MTSIDVILDDNVAAAAEVLEAASRAGDAWNTPRTPGGWSPAQVVEHVSLTLEQGTAVVSGRQSKFPNFPALLRPLVRGLYYNRVLTQERFPRARTTAALEPSQGGAALAEGTLACRRSAELQPGAAIVSRTDGRCSIPCSAPCPWRATPGSRCFIRHHLTQLPMMPLIPSDRLD